MWGFRWSFSFFVLCRQGVGGTEPKPAIFIFFCIDIASYISNVFGNWCSAPRTPYVNGSPSIVLKIMSCSFAYPDLGHALFLGFCFMTLQSIHPSFKRYVVLEWNMICLNVLNINSLIIRWKKYPGQMVGLRSQEDCN